MFSDFQKSSSGSDLVIVILGVRGVEYQIISSQLAKNRAKIKLVAIPAGLKPVYSFLEQLSPSMESINRSFQGVLLIGLCGSVAEQYKVGQPVLYKGCGYQTTSGQWHYLECDVKLTQTLVQTLGNKSILGEGISCDRVICQPEDKRKIRETYKVDVIDMESFAVLDFFQQQGIPVAILRVVSDHCQQKLPDLSDVFNSKGDLNIPYLIIKMIQNPMDSFHLILSSLQALNTLKAIATHVREGYEK